MTEPREFQGVHRAELIRQLVRHRELRRQTETQCERTSLIALQRGERLLEIAGKLGLGVDDDLAGAVEALVEASILNKEAMSSWKKTAQEAVAEVKRLREGGN